MGKLFVGHFGKEPEAESTMISLRDCNQRLGLKPSDFVSVHPPSFFKHARGAKGRYLVFELDQKEIGDAAVWKPGFYLLPLEAADVLQAFGKMKRDKTGLELRPVEVVYKIDPPADVLERATLWANNSQPLFFNCRCEQLILKMDAPWALRKRWGLRLTCKKRCQPAIKSLI